MGVDQGEKNITELDLANGFSFYLPNKSKFTNMSLVDAIIIIKYLRIDELERYSKEILYDSFKKTFLPILSPLANLQDHLKKNWYRKATVVYIPPQARFSLLDFMEIKSDAFNKKISAHHVIFNTKPIETIFKEIVNSAHEGRWVIIYNVEELKEQEMKLFVKQADSVLRDPLSKDGFKLWIIFPYSAEGGFKPLNFSSLNTQGIKLIYNKKAYKRKK